MTRAKLTSKGQLTLPKELRERLHLEAGDRIDFKIDDEGRLIGTPCRKAGQSDLAGFLGHLARPKPVTLGEMDRTIRNRSRDSSR